MALTLKLDGKEIGTLDGDKLTDAKGEALKMEEREVETITVPARRRPSEVPEKEEEEEDKPRKTKTKEVEEEREEVEDEEDELSERISSLMDEKLNQFLNRFETTRTSKGDEDINLDTLDAIPDEAITDKNDPYGVARTLKNITKVLKQQGQQVRRLDQAKSFDVAMDALKNEKAKFDIFRDKKLGPIAEKLLTAELSTNRVDPMARIVKRVAREAEQLSPKRTAEIVKAKEEAREKVPQGIRRSDGQSPAITVNKPKTVKEASEAYQAWRRGSDRLNRG